MSSSLSGLRPMAVPSIAFCDSDATQFMSSTGLSGIEKEGRWTDGPSASVTFALPPSVEGRPLIVKLEVSAFVKPDALPEQIVTVRANGVEIAIWRITNPHPQTRALFVEGTTALNNAVTIDFELPNCMSPIDVGINDDRRRLGIMLRRLAWQTVDTKPEPEALIWLLGRSVGGETRKSFNQKIEEGFWSRFINGPKVLDIGFRGDLADAVPITETAVGIDLDYPGYDGKTLPFDDESQDAVYSSHCLEHIPSHIKAIQEWHRVTKINGHIITVVPHAHLYERRRRPPSKWNGDHQRFYTPASLLAEFETALRPNSYRVRYLEDNDSDYDYVGDPNMHPSGCYEIVLVIQKIQPPLWELRG